MQRAKRIVYALAAVVAMTQAQAQAQGQDDAAAVAVRDRIKELYPATQITSVRAAEIPGLFEVIMKNNAAYTDATGRYFLFGRLFDMKAQVDLTTERLAEANKLDFDALPLKDAIKRVKGDGTRRLALFSDPDCPFCKRLEDTLDKLDNVTIYTFPYPLEQLHPDARRKSVAIWCAADKAKAWDDFMKSSKLPRAADCDNPVSRIIALGQTMGITGTPMMFTGAGRKVAGALPLEQIEAALNAGGQVVKVAQPAAGSK